MNTMKKMLALLLTLCMALALGACGQAEKATNTTPAGNPVETTTAPLSTKEIQQTTDPNRVAYTVYVVDEQGNPIPGGMLQFCLDSCSPVVIDENGVANFTGEAVNYDVKFLNMPEGYTYSTEEEVFHFAQGETELTIVLKSAA
ncbi:MAG: hypothetical protein ACI3W5_06415 [Faecousia sp.]